MVKHSFYFEIPLTAASSSEPAKLSEEDLKKLKSVPRAVGGILRTFGNASCEVHNLGHSFRVYVQLGGSSSLFKQADDVRSQIDLTAGELETNIKRDPPLALVQALTSMSYVDLLESISSCSPEKHLAPRYVDETSNWPLPVLSPQVFLKSSTQRSASRTGTFVIAGFYFHPKKGVFARLSQDLLDVAMPSYVLEQIIHSPISSLCGHMWFEGTIELAEDGTWTMLEGGRVTFQKDVDGV